MLKLMRAILAIALLAFALPGLSIAAPPAKPVAKLPHNVKAATTCKQWQPGTPWTLTATFTPPTLNVDGSTIALPLTFAVWMGTSSGGETQLASGIAGSPYVVTAAGLKANATYYVYVQAVDSNGVGLPSNEDCKSFPAAVPGSFTIVIS